MRRIISPQNLELKGLTGNNLKSLVQEDAVEHYKVVKDLVCEITTGFGKTNIAMLVIKAFKGQVINIVVPKLNLKDQWEDRLRKADLLKYVNVYVINTYTMYQDRVLDLKPDHLIIDEGHRCLNEESENFSTLLGINPESKHLILSASLKDKHKVFLDSWGISSYYEVTKHWAYSKGLVPFHTPMNVPIDLTAQEVSDYLDSMDTIYKMSRLCAGGLIYNAYERDESKITRAANIAGVDIGVVRGRLKKWKAGINKRRQVLYNAVNKKSIALEILNLIKEKCMIFCKSIEFAEELANNDPLGVVYHSKLKSSKKNNEKQEALDLFFNDIRPHIYSVDSLKEGIDILDCRFVLRAAYESGEGDTTQITGRIARFDQDNLNKESFLINFYVRPFFARGEEVPSQELEWLLSNQKLEHNIIWFDTALDVLNYVEQLFNKE